MEVHEWVLTDALCCVSVRLEGTSISSKNRIRLHDQMYHYLYGSGNASGNAEGY